MCVLEITKERLLVGSIYRLLDSLTSSQTGMSVNLLSLIYQNSGSSLLGQKIIFM